MKITYIKVLRSCFLISAILLTISAQAKVILPSVFSDNMVLQQKTNAAIWGISEPGKTIEISTTWDHQIYKGNTDENGNWKLVVLTPEYGGPYIITISDGERINLKNVMIGEVWVCSGQSNMEMPLAGWGEVKDYQKEISTAQFPNIRLLQVEKNTSNIKLNDAKVANGGWQSCSPETVAEFSSVAYFFAREIYKKKGIPIGLIHTSWGGTIAEAWTSADKLMEIPDFTKATLEVINPPKDNSGLSLKQKIELWNRRLLEKDAGYNFTNPIWLGPSLDMSTWKTMALPNIWDEAILPNMDGVVWFRKKIIIPQSWAGKDVKLNLGTIDDEDIVFLNGEKIGETKGHDISRVYTIPASAIKIGENALVVRVFDGGGDGGLYGDSNILSLTTETGEKISLDGDWHYKVGLDLKDMEPMPVSADGPNRPTVLFNAMINPFIQFTIRGAIWYQGESNADRAYQYRTLFPAMINDWRKNWNKADFPFYFVQLANYMKPNNEPQSSAWAELRDAQLQTLSLPNTGMAVSIDIGDVKDIHPKNKQDVGYRLALIALAKTYGEKIPYSGPVLLTQKINRKKVTLTFSHTDGGLKSQDGDLKGFALAGEDKKFYWATGIIKGDKIILKSKNVPNPVAVRYAWADNPVCNLYNGAGLPASPFRTDNWEFITFGSK